MSKCYCLACDLATQEGDELSCPTIGHIGVIHELTTTPASCPLPKRERDRPKRGKSIVLQEYPKCYGIDHGKKRNCRKCEHIESCSEEWSYRTWNIQKVRSYRHGVNASNSWDDIVRRIETI